MTFKHLREDRLAILPAIDLKGGKCVRLRQGIAANETIYGEDPVEMAKHWQDEGARYLHVVDLDGAFGGKPVHSDVITKIVAAIDIPVEVGGGLRTDEDVDRVLNAGADRAVLGTRVWAEPDKLGGLLQKYGEKLAVSIDARDGRVQIRGWTHTTSESAIHLAQRASEMGLKTLIFTDTSRDGMMDGVNVAAIDMMCSSVTCTVIASGGVASPEDIRALTGLGRENLRGVIIGRALYEGAIKLKDVQGPA